MTRLPLLIAGTLCALATLSVGAGSGETDAMLSGCAAPSALLAIEPTLARVASRLEKREKLVIVAVGSSSTEGIGASAPSLSYPSRLEAELRHRLPQAEIRVINRGKRGEDAPEELARLDREVLTERPDLVIWQVGTNAVLRREDIAADRELIRRGVERLHQGGSDVVLMDLQYAPRVLARRTHAEMERHLADVAASTRAGLFRRFEIMRHWQSEQRPDVAPAIGADGLHMTDRSYGCLAAGLAEAIARNWQQYQRDAEHRQTARLAVLSPAPGPVGNDP